MFHGKVAAYLSGISFKTDQKSEEKARLVVLNFNIQPFTKELAEEISPSIAKRIFKTDGERFEDIKAMRFAAKHPQQRVRWFAAPGDMPITLELRHVDVGPGFSVRADKETPDYAGSFDLVFAHPTANELQTIVHALNNSVWLEFDNEQEGLLKDPVDETPRVVRGRKSQPQAGATH